MKKALGLAVIMLFVGATTAMAQTIVGSAHDFQAASWNPGDEICIVCHTPHNADATVAEAPLWNHEVTVATFTPYSSSTLDATVGPPDAASKLCLSCHDGTVALENFGGATGGTSFVTGDALVGTDLSNDHPVSFTYDAALATADGDLADPSAASGLGGTIATDMLSGGEMQCSSCHGVHNESGLANFLIKSNSQSALCLTCHTK